MEKKGLKQVAVDRKSPGEVVMVQGSGIEEDMQEIAQKAEYMETTMKKTKSSLLRLISLLKVESNFTAK